MSDHYEPKGNTGSPLILLIAAVALGLLLLCLLSVAVFMPEWRGVLVTISCIVALPTIGLAGYLIYLFWNKPSDVIHITHEIDRPVYVADPKLNETHGLVAKIIDLIPDLGSLWEKDLNDYAAMKSGVVSRPEPAEHVAEEKNWILQLFDKLFAFVQTPIGATLATQTVENLGEDGGGGEDSGRGGCFSKTINFVIAGVVAVVLCCCIAFGAWWYFSSRDGTGSPDEVPQLTQPDSAPQLSLTATPALPLSDTTPPTVIPAAPAASQITNWTGPCAGTWCFDGYTAEGELHLYPWLRNTIGLSCTIPSDEVTFTQWTSAQWEAVNGYFFPLRDWYRTNYNSSVDLTAEAGNICGAFGGAPK